MLAGFVVHVAAFGATLNCALSPAVRVLPFVWVAVRMTPFSALEYVRPLIVTELVPALIVPLTVPPSEPLPVFTESTTFVLLNTLVGVPLAFCASTTTEKAVPYVGLVPPFTDVASFVGPELTVRVAVPTLVLCVASLLY